MTVKMDFRAVLFRTCLVGIVYMVVNACGTSGTEPSVLTKKGWVKGIRMSVGEHNKNEHNKKEVDVYYGIPFAKPPVGDLRFKHPIQNDEWTGIFDATKKPNTCWQGLDGVFSNFSGAKVWDANTNRSEDCLYLNVWVPRTSNKVQNKSVMIWIFGGGFTSGSSTLDIYDGKYLAAENDIIVVSMQYRVGALGFLALFHRDSPGNAGMFDQVMALDWVQQNIRRFGGNPNSVTLFGESAGAVSVGMHMLSPLSRSKFQRVILQSGAPHAAWAVLPEKEAKTRSMKLARLLGCKQDENRMEEIIECLREKPAESIFNQEWYTIIYGVVRFPYVPIVDGAFLTDSPEKSLNSNNFKKCPMLLGHNTHEANYWFVYYDQSTFTIRSEPKISQNKFDLLIDDFFHFHPYFPKILNSFGTEAIKFHYRNWIDPDDQKRNVAQLDHAVGDFNFICPTIDFAQHYASAGTKVYYYVFEHRSSVHHWPEWMGVLHGDEINFVFGEPLKKKGYTAHEKIFSKKIMKYWTNFAKSGDPNKAPGEVHMDEWPVYNNTTRQHLVLRADLINRLDKSKAIKSGSRVSECAFWKDYLPSLVMKTADMTDMELEWKIQFNEWSTKYIVDWKKQFDSFLIDHKREQRGCSSTP